MEGLLKLSNRIDRFNDSLGRAASWMLLAMTLITVIVVVFRYFFNLGWIWLQDSVLYMHGALFMLSAAMTLLHNEHVRVDVFYRPSSPVRKAWTDLLGFFFLLLPMVFLILLFGWEYVWSSWSILEGSKETGGLPGVFIIKTAILIFPVTLLAQGVSQSIKAWEVISQGGK